MAFVFGSFGAIYEDAEYVGYLGMHVFLFRQAGGAKDSAYYLMDYGSGLAHVVLFSSA